MRTLFGIPVGTLAVALVVACALAIGVVAALAVRNRVFFRLGVRNVRRRRARTALIVTGLMLGTAIIASALATGDTIGTTIRSVSIRALGQSDEFVTTRGPEWSLGAGFEGRGYFDERHFARVERQARSIPLVDGAAPAIIEPVAIVDLTSRQTEPRVSLFAADPRHMDGFGAIERAGGGRVTLDRLGPSEVFITQDAADELKASAGDRVRVLASGNAGAYTVREVVRYDGTGGTTETGAAVLMPLAGAQALLGKPGLVKFILISNQGGATSGARHSDAVVASLDPVLAPLGLEAQPIKQLALDLADETGNSFMTFFTTFGTFSIAAGVLLIFLIFVMLAAERRTEMGIARAVGTQRGHLVQMFVFEGAVYDLVAAAAGALLGVGFAFLMVLGLGQVFSGTGLDIRYDVEPRSLVIAYCLGVVLTFLVVTFSAWRVSVLNIVTAIRGLPAPRVLRRRRLGLALGVGGMGLGGVLTAIGVSSRQATPFLLGVSLAIISLIPLVRAAGLSERAAFTTAGLLLVAWWLLPADVLIPDYQVDFSIWIVGGLVLVMGASWVFVYNADIVLGLVTRLVGRSPRLIPVARLAAAYPLRNRFRTGVTISMFTLVVFTLVVATTNSNAFLSAFDNEEAFGGGFDVRATTSMISAVDDMGAAIRAKPGLDPDAVTVVAGESVIPVEARQAGPGDAAGVPVHGLDRAFLDHTTYEMAAMARGYGSARAVWRALATRPGLAVVDAMSVPRRANWAFAPLPDFRLRGFFLEDRTFAPVPVEVRDPQTGGRFRVTVIGVLRDTAPADLTGIFTSQATVARLGDRARPTVHHLVLAPGTDPGATATALESAFVANGMEAEATRDRLDDVIRSSVIFNRLIQGFIALGLLVGVAALGVISARSVVERRQQIGVLRSIGFQRRMIQGVFLLESSFIALGAIVLGTALGLAIAYEVIDDSRDQPSWEDMSFAVPWASFAIIFAAVFLIAMATTLVPALRASRVYPAEALRYE